MYSSFRWVGIIIGISMGAMLLWSPLLAGTEGACCDPSPRPDGALPQAPTCQDRLLRQLHNVRDPELDLDIVDLGIVRSIACGGDARDITVTIILTSPLCPYIRDIVAGIASESERAFPGSPVKVVVDAKTRWNPSNMSEEARKRFWGAGE